jgi:hypothetical protein
MHHTEWILQGDTLKTVSWQERRIKTTVELEDTEYWDYDEERDTKFYYRGQIISPGRNLDIETRTFTYIKRQITIKLNVIDHKKKSHTDKILFFIDNAEFININNLELYQDDNGKEYLFVYLKSGEDGLESGIYCYEMDDFLNNKRYTNFKIIPYIYLDNTMRIPENLSITNNQNEDNNLILTMMRSVGRTKIVLENYFLDFNNMKYTVKEIFSSDFVISMPKIIQNDKYRIICFKERIEKKRSNLFFGLLNQTYDQIIKEYRNGFYLYDTPRASRMNYIERDNGIQPVWISENEILFSVTTVAHEGNAVRAAGIDLFMFKFNIKSGRFDKKLMMKEKPDHVYLNFDLHYFPDENIFQNLWIIETDTNRNGYPDRDVFLTNGNYDQGSFNTINLSYTPRSEWSPQILSDDKDKNSTNHYVWLVEHPKHGYQFYYRNNRDEILANIVENLNLPLYGDTPETIFTGLFYILLTIGLGIFEGTILNGITLFITIILIIIIYKIVPHINHTAHVGLLILLSLIIILSYGLSPLSFPITNPNISIFIGGSIFSLICLILIDRVFYKKNIHSPAETSLKIWFFSILMSIYMNYDYISTFIESNMIVRING